MDAERTAYLERTPWPTWVRAIFWGITGLVCLALVAGWDTTLGAPQRIALATLVAAGAKGMHALLGGLTVRVQQTRIVVHLGAAPLIKRSVPFSEIRSAASVRYRPIVEFGGWGIRGTRKRRAWTARGNEAVALELVHDRQLLIGSDKPRRLEDRIRSALSDRARLEGGEQDAQDGGR